MSEMDNVSKKVVDDAKKERERILDEAGKKAAEIIEGAEKRAKEVRREGKLKAWNRYREVLNVELSKIKAELNQKILLYRVNLIDDVVAGVKEKLSNMDREDYKKFLEKNIKALNLDRGYYLIGSEEKIIDSKMVESISDLKKLDDKPDFKKGIKIIKEKAEYHMSPEILIDSEIDDIRMEIASQLFGNSRGKK